MTLVHARNSQRRSTRGAVKPNERESARVHEVLRELGYSDDEIIDFTSRGVLVHTRATN